MIEKKSIQLTNRSVASRICMAVIVFSMLFAVACSIPRGEVQPPMNVIRTGTFAQPPPPNITRTGTFPQPPPNVTRTGTFQPPPNVTRTETFPQPPRPPPGQNITQTRSTTSSQVIVTRTTASAATENLILYGALAVIIIAVVIAIAFVMMRKRKRAVSLQSSTIGNLSAFPQSAQCRLS